MLPRGIHGEGGGGGRRRRRRRWWSRRQERGKDKGPKAEATEDKEKVVEGQGIKLTVNLKFAHLGKGFPPAVLTVHPLSLVMERKRSFTRSSDVSAKKSLRRVPPHQHIFFSLRGGKEGEEGTKGKGEIETNLTSQHNSFDCRLIHGRLSSAETTPPPPSS